MERRHPVTSRAVSVRSGLIVLIATALLAVLPLAMRGAVLFTNLVTFNGTNGSGPIFLLQDTNGSLYGTTTECLGRAGSIFHLSPSGSLETLAKFYWTNGNDPLGPFTLTADGTMYGITYTGGAYDLGAVYKLSPSTTNIVSLFSFNGTNGGGPGGLVLARDGTLYGFTFFGGIGWNGQWNSGFGTIFRIDTNEAFATVLAFNGTNGNDPTALISARDGALYGTTSLGGIGSSPIVPAGLGAGTVFKISPDSEFVTLASFDGTNGAFPHRLIEGVDGYLYGTASDGGSGFDFRLSTGYGTIFRVSTNGMFAKVADCSSAGSRPISIIQTTDGTLYGTSEHGNVFRVDPGIGTTVIYTFQSLTGTSQFCYELIELSQSVLLGQLTQGGDYGLGSVFRMQIMPDPTLLQASGSSGGLSLLDWNAWPGRSYQLQFSPWLAPQRWTNCGSSILATNVTMKVPPPIAGSANGFYRMMMVP